MVGRVKCRTNRAIDEPRYPFGLHKLLRCSKRIRNEVMKTKYLETNLSAAQLGEEFGLSEQAALGRLRGWSAWRKEAGKGINKESNKKDVQEKKRHEEEDRLEER